MNIFTTTARSHSKALLLWTALLLWLCLLNTGLSACGDNSSSPITSASGNLATPLVTTSASTVGLGSNATTSTLTNQATGATASSVAASAITTKAVGVATVGSNITATALTGQFSREAVATALTKEGATLNFYWPAGGSVKTWINDKLIPGFKDYVRTQYGVDINVNILATGGGDGAVYQKLTAYEQANPNDSGKDFDIDLVRLVPSADLLDAIAKGWFTPVLPKYSALLTNLANVNKPGLNSFTNSTTGSTFAIPVYEPTISFFYNKDKVATPPQSVTELLDWAKANPKRFTYEDPRSSSGTGSGSMFLTTVMKTFGDVTKPQTYSKGFDFLKQLQDYIYPQPTEDAQMVELMKRGDVWLMAFWNDFGLASARDQNITFMTNYFPKEGTPVRNTPIAVPRSAAHQMAGLLFLNYALSDPIQRELALTTQQVPASISQGVWKDLPTNIFGYDFSYIEEHTFASFNTEESLTGIQTMVNQFPQQVLGK